MGPSKSRHYQDLRPKLDAPTDISALFDDKPKKKKVIKDTTPVIANNPKPHSNKKPTTSIPSHYPPPKKLLSTTTKWILSPTTTKLSIWSSLRREASRGVFVSVLIAILVNCIGAFMFYIKVLSLALHTNDLFISNLSIKYISKIVVEYKPCIIYLRNNTYINALKDIISHQYLFEFGNEQYQRRE
eukprot:61040_1